MRSGTIMCSASRPSRLTRSLRLGNRLIAGVQLSCMCSGPNAASAGSARSSRMMTSMSGRGAADGGAVQPGQGEEQEPLRERVVFLQQAVAVEGVRRARQQRLVLARTRRAAAAERGRRSCQGSGRVAGADDDAGHMGGELLVEPHARPFGAAEEEAEPLQRELADRACRRCVRSRSRMAALALPGSGQAERGDAGLGGDVLRLRHLDRQQLHRVRGAEHAVGLVLGAEQAAQLGAGRQRDAGDLILDAASGVILTIAIEGVGAR